MVNFRATEKKGGSCSPKLCHMFKTFPKKSSKHVYTPVNNRVMNASGV